MKTTDKIFARKCDATGKGMNEGVCVADGMEYFSTIELYIKNLREEAGLTDDEAGLTDDELLEYSYNEGWHYHTEWEDTDEDSFYLADGTEITEETIGNYFEVCGGDGLEYETYRLLSDRSVEITVTIEIKRTF